MIKAITSIMPRCARIKKHLLQKSMTVLMVFQKKEKLRVTKDLLKSINFIQNNIPKRFLLSIE